MKKCALCGLENDDDEVCCCECGGTQFNAIDAHAKSETQTAQQPGATHSPKPKQPEYEFSPLSEADRRQDLVTLVACRTLTDADIVVSRLCAAGITAIIPDENVMQWVGWNVNTFGYVRVQISPKDHEAARDLLAG